MLDISGMLIHTQYDTQGLNMWPGCPHHPEKARRSAYCCQFTIRIIMYRKDRTLKIHAKAWKDRHFGIYQICLCLERSSKIVTSLHHWITSRCVVLYLKNHCFIIL